MAVLRQEEIFSLQSFDGGVEGVVIDKNGAKNGTLRVEVVGKGAFQGSVNRHGQAATTFLRFCFAIIEMGGAKSNYS
jgi:hypothetical protein